MSALFYSMHSGIVLLSLFQIPLLFSATMGGASSRSDAAGREVCGTEPGPRLGGGGGGSVSFQRSRSGNLVSRFNRHAESRQGDENSRTAEEAGRHSSSKRAAPPPALTLEPGRPALQQSGHPRSPSVKMEPRTPLRPLQ